MAYQIVKKSNKKFAVWSTIADDFVLDDASKRQVENLFINEAILRQKENLKEIFDKIKTGMKPYYQFTMTYQEMLKIRKINVKANEGSK